MPKNLSSCVVFRFPHVFCFIFSERLSVCRGRIAAHACLPLLQPATILDVGLELQSAHMGAHLADQPVTGERMKAKPNESTHSQNLLANICPTLQLQPASLSHQSKTTQLPFSGLFLGSLELQVYMIFYVLQGFCGLQGFGNVSKTQSII